MAGLLPLSQSADGSSLDMPTVASNCAITRATVLVNPMSNEISIDGMYASAGGGQPPRTHGSTTIATTLTVLNQ